MSLNNKLFIIKYKLVKTLPCMGSLGNFFIKRNNHISFYKVKVFHSYNKLESQNKLRQMGNGSGFPSEI